VFEAGLATKLAELQPMCVRELVAAYTDHGWLLMREGGMRLRGLIETPADLHHWEKLSPGTRSGGVLVGPCPVGGGTRGGRLVP
jgi:hypothetical protein